MNSELLRQINTKLVQNFGRLGLSARYRLIWSESELATEKRKTVAAKFDNSGNQIGTEEGVLERKKYPWIGNRYLLEKFTYAPVPDLVGSENGHYELIYVTQDAKEQFLPPKWEVYEALCNYDCGNKATVHTDWAKYFESESSNYKQWVKDVVAENHPLFMAQKNAGELVRVPRNFEKGGQASPIIIPGRN